MRRSLVRKVLEAWLVVVSVMTLVATWSLQHRAFTAEQRMRNRVDRLNKNECGTFVDRYLSSEEPETCHPEYDTYDGYCREYDENGYRVYHPVGVDEGRCPDCSWWGSCPRCISDASDPNFQYSEVACECAAKQGRVRSWREKIGTCTRVGRAANAIAFLALLLSLWRRARPVAFREGLHGLRECLEDNLSPRRRRRRRRDEDGHRAETTKRSLPPRHVLKAQADDVVALVLVLASFAASTLLFVVMIYDRTSFRGPRRLKVTCERRWLYRRKREPTYEYECQDTCWYYHGGECRRVPDLDNATTSEWGNWTSSGCDSVEHFSLRYQHKLPRKLHATFLFASIFSFVLFVLFLAHPFVTKDCVANFPRKFRSFLGDFPANAHRVALATLRGLRACCDHILEDDSHEEERGFLEAARRSDDDDDDDLSSPAVVEDGHGGTSSSSSSSSKSVELPRVVVREGASDDTTTTASVSPPWLPSGSDANADSTHDHERKTQLAQEEPAAVGAEDDDVVDVDDEVGL